MSVIEHTVHGCPECRAPIDGRIVWHLVDCPLRSDDGLTVNVVRASDYQGAVDHIERAERERDYLLRPLHDKRTHGVPFEGCWLCRTWLDGAHRGQ